MERFAFIQGEKYAFFLGGSLVSATFQNTYCKAPAYEHRFVRAEGEGNLINSARAVSLKNESGWVLQNPSTGLTQPLTAAPMSKRAAKMRRQRRLADLQRKAFFKQFEGCTYMAKAHGGALFKRVAGPLPR
jgi:hypothetical protein